MGKLVIPKATSVERVTITPDAGELIYDETNGHIYEGDGSTVGGVVIGTGERNTNSDAGSASDGEGLVNTKVGTDTPLKRIKAGTNITLTSEANDIVINSSGGGSGSITGFVQGYGASSGNTNDPHTTGFTGTVVANTEFFSPFQPIIVDLTEFNNNTSIFSIDSDKHIILLETGFYKVLIGLASVVFRSTTTLPTTGTYLVKMFLSVERSGTDLPLVEILRFNRSGNSNTFSISGTDVPSYVEVMANDKIGFIGSITSSEGFTLDTTGGFSYNSTNIQVSGLTLIERIAIT